MNIIFSKKVLLKSLYIILFCLSAALLFSLSIQAENTNKQGYVVLNNKKITLDIADSPYLREKGLMYKDSLPENQGMVFIFDEPSVVSFWMKNVKISLDMVFISDSKIVKIYKDVPICKNEPCEIYPSKHLVDSVIELKGGFCQSNNIKVGQTVKYSPDIIRKLTKKVD